MRREVTTTDSTLADDLAAVDAPKAVAERERHAQAIFEDLPLSELIKLSKRLSMADRNHVAGAHHTAFEDIKSAEWHAAANAEARRRFREAAVRELAAQLRLVDMQAVMTDPDRAEAERVRSTYNRQVAAVAISKGTKEHAFIEKFATLIADRADAEAVGDDGAVRRAEAALTRHVGVVYPQLPAAAWDSADLMADAAARDAEYRRLAAKYGPRTDRKSTRSRTRAGATA
jgi:hypothetical protein